MKYLLVVILAILTLSTHSADTLATTLAQVLAGVSNGADRNGLLSILNGLNSKNNRQSAEFDKWLQETNRERATALSKANQEVTKARHNRNIVISNNAASKKADEARHKRETEALAEEKRVIAKIINMVKNIDGKKRTGVSSGTSSDWKRYSSSGVYIDIDTSRHGLGSNTDYFTSLISKDEHKPVTGVSSIYAPKKNGFRVYLRYQNGQKFTVADVQAKGWRLGWVGVKSNGDKFKHGVTSKGWKKYSTKDLRVDTRDPFKNVKGHTVFTTMSGNSQHWASRGASSVYPTSTGFRNYIAGSHINYAAKFGYKIHWLSVKPDSNTFHTGASRAWTQSKSGELKIKIDLKSLGLTRTPVVISSVHGTSSHWTSTGANSIIDPSPEGFTVYLRGGYNLHHAKNYKYELQWAVLKE